MYTKLLAGCALTVVIAAVPVAGQAQSMQDDTMIGSAAGGTTGAIAGAFVGGPVGAIVGGFAGATFGAAASVPDRVVEYSVAHPVRPAPTDVAFDVGAPAPAVTVYEVPNDPRYAYFYSRDRAYIVDRRSNEIVYSPGYVVPRQTVDYVETNPGPSVSFSGRPVNAGMEVPADVPLAAVPRNRAYSYVYVDGRPVVVDRRTRVVVWVR